MPQLDNFILASQLNIIVIFMVGYLLFLYYILPVLTFFFKLDSKLIINKYKDYSNVSSYLTSHKNLFDTTSLFLINLSIIYKLFNDKKKKNTIILNFL